MKRYILIAAALLAVLFSSRAQTTPQRIRVHHNGMVVYDTTTAAVDSMTATGAYNLQLHQSGQVWSRSIDNIDSLTFYYATGGDNSDTGEVDYESGLAITWNNGSAPTVINAYASQGVTVSVSGEHVTVVSTAGIADLTYRLSGSSSNGSLTLTSDYKLILLMDGLSLTNPAGAAVNMLSDKRCTVHLAAGSSNTLCDGAGGSNKGALQAQGKLDFQGNGSLQVSGYTKHGIQSSGRCTVNAGDITVTTAVKDGMNVDDLMMYGGTLRVYSLGDGIDGDQGCIDISGGTVYVTTTADDTKGIGCDSTIHIGGGSVTVIASGADAKGLRSKQSILIDGGEVTVSMSGDQSKGIKVDGTFTLSAGDVTVNASGSYVPEASGNGYDPSYCTGVKADGNVYMTGGSMTVNCPSSNTGGKAISCDSDITLAGGMVDITVAGACGTYTDSTGGTNSFSSAGIKCDGRLTVTGGDIVVRAYGKALSADGDVTVSGGRMELSTNGAGAVTTGSGSSATDGYTSSCIKSDGNIVITGGTVNATSTGKGGRGIVADGALTVGQTGAADSLVNIYVTTSGAPVNTTSSGGGPGGGHGGGGWPGGGGGNTDYWKGIAKAIRVDGNITINSGHVQAYCSQTSGDPTAEAIESKDSITVNGGYVETNAYDDAINAASHIAVNGGHVWAYSRGNDAIDCNGTYIHITGGVVIAYSAKECGIDDNADNGGTHLYISNATVVCSGTMGAIEGTPSVSGQKYLVLNNYSLMQNGFCVKSGSDEVLTFKMGSVSGSGFSSTESVSMNVDTGAKRISGVFVTAPQITGSSYTYYSSPGISGGSNWHGLYSGATVTTSGSGSTVTAR
ncbi:MAG: hypothetical protein AUK63_1613 [bacterium P3]|nr:MAG: hypothetical protein AUK63_1613 [bacterium P3]KWW38991.1 MAG: hypothetical protein F083_1951 [bacterium F083]